MATILKANHWRRYRDIIRLLVKYGRADLVSQIGLDDALAEERTAEEAPPKAEELAADLEALGPAYIKLGQLLSTRSDFLPPAYTKALVRLQDHVAPFPFSDVQRIVESELGIRISKAFQEFDAEPLAAASLGQVHHAVLRDGREVAVKVQRPGIRDQISRDLETFREVAELFEHYTEFGKRYALSETVNQLRKTLIRELDYRQEASNLQVLGENLKRYKRIIVPQPIDGYTTSRVLTMHYVKGTKVTELSPVARTETDTTAIANDLFKAYLQQILVDGVVHADPHPGNVFLTRDGRVALIDLGMVAHIPPQLQENLIKLLLAVSEGRGEDAAEVAVRISEKTEFFDEPALRRAITDIVVETNDMVLEQIEVGRLVLEIAHVAGQSGALVPSQMTMLGKALLNLDIVGRTLDPDFNPNDSIRRHASKLVREHMRGSMSLTGVYNTLLEANEFAQQLPNRLNRIMGLIAKNEMRLQVDAIDENRLIQGIQKVANRITMGLILAALIVGAALTMNVKTEFTLFGYPGLAILLFLGAAAGGVILILNIAFNDE